ncbi:D-alanyl-D-alanine-carboxypeptidase/endopeptidase AmpH [Bradyrhizobium sp. CER78]|uniref:D-alanyl-D-alanine- carboxypeptidase/endopeptidase AmpH n=1 Tax=Bradyrhizobium sp. CER78 TaxID=3039162 RepID=UPI002448C0DC|nr:D-alanyl-D-alanine-carboxypeptidase/endopeptidase AmpH [Bradyrhizobium sp. CER78]MDH2384435.1 D-alanyl-D-alanine-carboxypeptidase/endopeptidase AmpH [Bradyrhizobium sp. CER78]
MRLRGRVSIGIAMLAMVVLCSGQAAAEDLALRDAVTMTGTAMFLNSGAPGLVLAVVRGDDSIVQGYGETAPGDKLEPDGRSIIRLGSISKVFASDLLATLAAEGRVGLTDPLSRYAPAGVTVRSYGDQPFSLLDLATHSAGLPREVPDPAVKDGDGNPFLAFTRDVYWKWTGTNAPAYAPGTTAMYSNFGYGLLGEALAKAGGKPYADLLRDKVIAPLQLADTTLRLSDAQRPRLMVGLDPFGKPDPNWEVPNIMYASAGVYSTADDMVRWMRWHLARDDKSAAALSLAHAMWRPHDGLARLVGVEVTGAEGMGLGWIVSPAHDGVPLLLGKSGGLGGFMSYVVLSPNRRLGIFVAASRVNFAMFEGLRTAVRDLAAELAPAGP